MKDFPGPESFQSQRPQIRIEDLDFSKLPRILRWIVLAVILIVLVMGLAWARTFYTDWLWFSGLGHESVLLKMMTTRIWLFLLGAAIFSALAAPNLYAAFRAVPRAPSQPGQGLPTETQESARKLLMWVAGGAAALAALFMAGKPASEWDTVLRFLNGVSFNQIDPIFQKDLSFYIFTLPALNLVRSWLMSTVVVIMVIAAGFYYIAATLRGERFALTGKVKSHLAVLGAFLFVLFAAGHWLGRYELLYSPTGAVYGVGYTDDHVTLPVRPC